MDQKMTGFLKKRSAHSYTIVIYLGRDPATGKKRQKWHTVDGNKKKAEEELTRLLHELNTGTYIEPSKLTMKDYLERWLKDYAKGAVGKKTFERYEGIVRDHLVPELGTLVLTKLQPLHIQSCYTKWREGGRRDGREGGLSAQTILHHHRVLSEALHQAVRWQLVGRNVAEAVEPPTPEYREIQVLQEDEFVHLLDAAKGTRLYIPILLAGTTAMRRGEILAVRWRDVDFVSRLISVNRSLQETREGLFFKEPKPGRFRTLDLLPFTAEALEAYRQAQGDAKHALADGYEDNDLICCQDDGRLWAPSAFTSAYRDLLRRRKIPNVRFHNFRHSHATQLLRDGENPKMVSERLGHSRVAFTLERYGHVLPGMQKGAATRSDGKLRSALERQQQVAAQKEKLRSD
jgi:integrase